MKPITTIIAVALTLAAGTVLAQQPTETPSSPAATPQAMDHDKMGMQHDQMDHGKMDMQHGQMDHSKMDMSGEKSADHQKMAAVQFAKLDTNKDGSLSEAEFAEFHAMMGMQHGPMTGKNGQMDHSGMGMQQGEMAPGNMDHSKMDMSGMNPADHQKMAADEFVKLDTNKDGKLVKIEIAAEHPLTAHFDMLDTDKDGSVSKAEFDQHHGM